MHLHLLRELEQDKTHPIWHHSTMPGRVITFAQHKGGSGKTTLAANLAVAFSRLGLQTAIVDTDPQGSLGRWYMARRGRLGDDKGSLGFRTASAWGAHFEAEELAKTYDRVIIDTPPKTGPDVKPAIKGADLVILPVIPSLVDIWATGTTADLAQKEGKPVLVVLNRANRRARLLCDVQSSLAAMHLDCAQAIIGNRITFAEVMSRGAGVMEDRAKSSASLEIATLAQEIDQRLD